MAQRISIETQLSKAETEFNQAKNRLFDLKAQAKSAARKDKKKREDRRKILAGACALNMMQSDAEFRALFSARLGAYLTREIDRAVFPDLLQSKN
jgi:capsule polysaccharide export protein KpsE/RkpR